MYITLGSIVSVPNGRVPSWTPRRWIKDELTGDTDKKSSFAWTSHK